MKRRIEKFHLTWYWTMTDKLPVIDSEVVKSGPVLDLALQHCGLDYRNGSRAFGDWKRDPEKLLEPQHLTVHGTNLIIMEFNRESEGTLSNELLVLIENHGCPNPKEHKGRPCFYYAVVSGMT